MGLTYEQIMQNMMAHWDSKYDKRQGSLVYDACDAAANQIAQLYLDNEDNERNAYPDTASREFLLDWAVIQNITVQSVSSAVFRAVFNVDAEVTIGSSRFNQADLNFLVIDAMYDSGGTPIPGQYKTQCETAGVKGNGYIGKLTPITPVLKMTSGANVELLIPGEDDEETEVIREHVLESFDSKEFGGNRQSYKTLVNSIPGVGGCHLHRRVGDNISVIIIASDFSVPSQTLIDAVQTSLDPVENSGEGIGTVPIGHRVGVTGVTPQAFDISVKVDLIDGYTWEAVKPNMEAQINRYLLRLRESWEDATVVVVRIAELIAAVVNLDGVLDITELLINGTDSNVVMEETVVPVLGELIQLENEGEADP